MWVLDVTPQDCLCEGVGFVVVTVSWSIGVCLNCDFGVLGGGYCLVALLGVVFWMVVALLIVLIYLNSLNLVNLASC